MCSDLGTCVLGFSPLIASNDPSCATQSDADKLTKLVHIFNKRTDPAGVISCHDDVACPCGSFCDNGEMECAVECSGLPNSTLTCDDSHATCDVLGHCVTVIDPAPTIQLALVLSPTAVSRDTYAGPVTTTVDASVDALDIAYATSPHPASVIYSLVEVDGVTPPPDPTTVPQIKCPSSGTFASQCTIEGGWTFASGSIHAATRPINVRLPKTTTAQTWTLQASSDWSSSPTTTTLRAEPVVPPPAVAGHYTGKLTLTSSIGPVIKAPVDAVVTDSAVALVDRSSTILPDGHADFSRDPTKVTMVRWLSSTINSVPLGYDAKITVGALVQNPQTGKITFPGTLTLGAGTTSSFEVALDRVSDLEPAACSYDTECPARDPNHPENDTYCDTVVHRCVLGRDRAAGPGIVDASSSSSAPSTTLQSSAIAAWRPHVRSLRDNNIVAFGGFGYDGVVEAYCARAPLDADPPHLDRGGPLAAASLDTQCKPFGAGGSAYPQTMFPFADKTQEFVPGLNNQNNIVLQDQCNADLAVVPSADLATKNCVSLPRFYASLEADQDAIQGGGTGSDSQRSLIAQVLRQWLGLNTYLAGTAVQAQDLHDVLSDDQVSRQTRLAQAADVMEQSLGLLIDPGVRPQFTSGSQVIGVTQSPDNRLPARPVARWTFNNTNLSTIANASVADAEGTNSLSLAYAGDANGRITLANGNLQSSGFGGTRTCRTSAPVTLDDRSYTISAALRYVPFNGQTVNLVTKHAASGHELKLDATTADRGQHITLKLRDSNGGVATFVIPWQPGNWSSTSLFAVVADEGRYRVYVANSTMGTSSQVASSVTGGGPRWGDAGTVDFACQAPGAAACNSIDRILPGDALDLTTTGWCAGSPVNNYTCHIMNGQTCTGLPYSYASTVCPALQSEVRTNLIAQAIAGGASSSAANAIGLTSTPNIVDLGSDVGEPGESWTWIDWNCALCVTQYPIGTYAFKPMCGQGGIWSEWDEIALWSHPLTLDEFSAMVARYNYTPANETLPPKTAAPAGDEQKAGLPVYMLESINADLQLVASYLVAEDDIVYGDCYQGKSSAELPIAVGRASRHLRLAAVLAAEATQLAALADSSAAWRPRYNAALQVFGARHDAVIQKMRSIFECTNSLGITDGEVPVYAGGSNALDPKARFFAGSSFLLAKAHDAINAPANGAETLRVSAQNHYRDARVAAFNVERGPIEKQDRINALAASAEDQLRKFCGTKATDTNHPFPLYDGFNNGTLSAANCFIKLEDPACAPPPNPDARTFGSIPEKCLRGEIGERIVAIKTALKDQDNAKNAADRAQALYDNQTKYCVETVGAAADKANALLTAHQETMKKIRDRMNFANLIGGLAKAAQNIGVAIATGGSSELAKTFGNKAVGGPSGPSAGISSALDLGLTFFQQRYQGQLQAENDAYEREVTAAQGDANLAACNHAAEQMKPSIDAAMDANARAVLEAQAALFAIGDNMNAATGVFQAAKGQIALENTINRTPPQLHYWLDVDIANYSKQMAYARRLTYLTVRAFDYEAQRDSGKRGRVLSARTPLDLLAVLTEIDALHGGVDFNQNSLGLQPVFPSVTLSLRDEIMNFHPPTGLTAESAFSKLVKSDENRVFVTGFDNQQHLLGHGIKFSLGPNQAWNNLLCDERTWRITIHPEITGRATNLSQPFVLFQTNAFSSQTCRQQPGNITTTRVRQTLNLFTNDDPNTFSAADPYFNAPMTIPPNLTKETLGGLPQDSSMLDGAFAGRGLYGDYILVFPICEGVPGCSNANGYTLENLDKLYDVTIRIDMSAANNVPNNPH